MRSPTDKQLDALAERLTKSRQQSSRDRGAAAGRRWALRHASLADLAAIAHVAETVSEWDLAHWNDDGLRRDGLLGRYVHLWPTTGNSEYVAGWIDAVARVYELVQPRLAERS
jgi:hypothetical protein